MYYLCICRNRKATVAFTVNEAAHKTGLVIGYSFSRFCIFRTLGKVSNPLHGLEHAFESAGRKTDMIEYAPQERVLSRFACMLASSNNGRAWNDFDLSSYCDSCADKVFHQNQLFFDRSICPLDLLMST